MGLPGVGCEVGLADPVDRVGEGAARGVVVQLGQQGRESACVIEEVSGGDAAGALVLRCPSGWEAPDRGVEVEPARAREPGRDEPGERLRHRSPQEAAVGRDRHARRLAAEHHARLRCRVELAVAGGIECGEVRSTEPPEVLAADLVPVVTGLADQLFVAREEDGHLAPLAEAVLARAVGRVFTHPCRRHDP